MPLEEKESDLEPSPEPVQTEVKALEAWNDPAFIESVAAEGFPGSSVHTDEAFRYHLSHFATGGTSRQVNEPEPELEPEAEPEPEPEAEPIKRSHHKK